MNERLSERRELRARRIFLLMISLLFIFGCKDKGFNENDLKSGDIIFQTLPGELSEVISKVTETPMSHCGMVIKSKNGDIKVIEAVGPVRIIAIDDFIRQGINKSFAVIRLKRDDLDIDKVIKEAKKFLGKPYDYLYKLDDKEIYCSELVYKAFLNGAGVKIARTVKLKSLNYKGSIPFIKSLTGGEVPLERDMVTPIDIYNNSNLFTKLYSDYAN